MISKSAYKKYFGSAGYLSWFIELFLLWVFSILQFGVIYVIGAWVDNEWDFDENTYFYFLLGIVILSLSLIFIVSLI